MNMQQFLALETVFSGIVSVNGKIIKTGACIVSEIDVAAVDGIRISNKGAIREQQLLLLIVNKPSGCVCSHVDRHNPEINFDFVPKECSKKKLLSCGSVEKETERIIMGIDDSDIARKLTHPSDGRKTFPVPNV
jgi:16S rRNA U516 pseudouridylate synthase RsuA-like enzyme